MLDVIGWITTGIHNYDHPHTPSPIFCGEEKDEKEEAEEEEDAEEEEEEES